jgi:HEAT repeat protein
VITVNGKRLGPDAGMAGLVVRVEDMAVASGRGPCRSTATAPPTGQPARRAPAARAGGAGTCAATEAVYALVATEGSGPADELLRILRHGDWRAQVAAADEAGRLGIVEAVPVLLSMFEEAERELPYPPLTKWWRWSRMLRNPDAEEGWDESLPMPLAEKRWRVKRAVVAALGRLGDPRAVGPLENALLRCDDYFPVTSQLPVALGRLGAPGSAAVLERFVDHAEINTRVHARLALALLRGDLSRAAFEQAVT